MRKIKTSWYYYFYQFIKKLIILLQSYKYNTYAFVQQDTLFHLVGIKYLIGWSYFRDRATLHLLMRNLKFYEIARWANRPGKAGENWFPGDEIESAETRVLHPVFAEISRGKARCGQPIMIGNSGNVPPHRWSLQWLIVSWPFYYFDVYVRERAG